MVVPDHGAVAEEAARRVALAIDACLKERGECSFAITGGSHVAIVCELLSHYSLDWPAVEFFFAEERCVAPNHPASVYAMAAGGLFENPRIEAHHVHRIEFEGRDVDEAADRYAEELPERFDVLLLDVGMDGHVGALFPGSAAFDEEERWVVPVEAPMKPRRRVTVVPELLAATPACVVIGYGREKADAVRRALREPGEVRDVPARLVRDATWVVDRWAAGEAAEVPGGAPDPAG